MQSNTGLSGLSGLSGIIGGVPRITTSGGVLLSGSSDIVPTYIIAPSGSLAVHGNNTIAFLPTYRIATTGGLAFDSPIETPFDGIWFGGHLLPFSLDLEVVSHTTTGTWNPQIVNPNSWTNGRFTSGSGYIAYHLSPNCSLDTANAYLDSAFNYHITDYVDTGHNDNVFAPTSITYSPFEAVYTIATDGEPGKEIVLRWIDNT